jgi:protein-tyrosine phosphatase
LEESDLQKAGLVIALNRVEHYPMMQKYFPAWAEKVVYWDVADLGFTTADDALSVIEQQINELANELATRHNQ